MRIAKVALTALIAWLASCAWAHAFDKPALVAFVNVDVVPMDRERILRRQTVIVQDATIVAVGRTGEVPVPADATTINGNGGYLLPGLADMHTHLEAPEDAAMYVAAGVTTVLNMGEQKHPSLKWIHEAIDSGSSLGPRIFFSFRLEGADAPGGWPIGTPDAARTAVKAAKDAGYDFIKVYNELCAACFEAIADEARKNGMAVVGHGVRSVGLPASLFKGLKMVAHAEEFYYSAFRGRRDDTAIPAIVDATFESGAYVTPNLSAFEAFSAQWGKPKKVDEYLRDPRASYMSPQTRLGWTRRAYEHRAGDLAPVLAFLSRFTKALSDRGVPLLAGTDSPVVPGLVPGDSIRDDLHLLVAAGMTPFQALSAATRTPGEFLAATVPGSGRTGVVAVGARADLLLVDGNPLESLDALAHVRGVLLRGRWKTAEELEAILQSNEVRMDAELRRSFGR